MQPTLLISNDFALEECASLQPNSRSWQNETGTLPVGGLTTVRRASMLAARFMPGTMGVVRPSDSPLMAALHVEGGPAYTGRTDRLALNPFAFDGKLGFSETGGIMPEEIRPASLEMQINNTKNGNSGPISTFNNLNTGSHSRPDGLPPLPDAAAPPGRTGADPGGGPTAS